MKELLRSNDAVLLSYVEALLSEAGVAHALLDTNMSIVEGSLGILPRRMLVSADEWERALRILQDADLGHVIARP